MDRGPWRATAHRVTESDRTEQLTLSLSTLGSLWSGGRGRENWKAWEPGEGSVEAGAGAKPTEQTLQDTPLPGSCTFWLWILKVPFGL